MASQRAPLSQRSTGSSPAATLRERPAYPARAEPCESDGRQGSPYAEKPTVPATAPENHPDSARDCAATRTIPVDSHPERAQYQDQSVLDTKHGAREMSPLP